MSEQQTSPAANPWMRPMSAQLLVRKEPPRPAPVPVGPYTPNEPDENEAIYAARAAAARQQVAQNGDLLSPVQLAVEQAAQEAHAARQTGSEPTQPDAVFYQQATGVQQQEEEPRQPAQPVQPHRLPMSAYAVAQLENQAITRQADAAALADPMLVEEAQQTTQPRRRRMVMRQEREAAEAAEAAAVPVAQEEAPEAPAEEAVDEAVAAYVDEFEAEMAIPEEGAAEDGEAVAEEASAEGGEEATEEGTAEGGEENAAEEVTAENSEIAAEEATVEESPADNGEAATETTPEDTAAAGQEEEPVQEAQPEAEPAPDPQPELQPEEAAQPDADAEPESDPEAVDCDLKLSQLDPAHPSEEYFKLPLENPLKEYAWYTDDVLDEEDDPEEDCVDTSAMPVPVPVSTIDVPKVRRGKRVLSFLLVLMLLLAAGGYLWISGHGEVLYRKAVQLVERLITPTVSTGEMTVSPETAALPALLTVTLTTDSDITAMELVNDDDQPLVADITSQQQGEKARWSCTVRMDAPYSGYIRARCLCADGQWRIASQKRYVEVN